MDFNIFLFGIVTVLILMVLGLIGRDKDIIWAIFPAIGGLIGIYFTISLLADGSLTTISGGTSTVIASASTGITSVWQFIELTPLAFSIGAFMVALYKGVKSL